MAPRLHGLHYKQRRNPVPCHACTAVRSRHPAEMSASTVCPCGSTRGLRLDRPQVPQLWSWRNTLCAAFPWTVLHSHLSSEKQNTIISTLSLSLYIKQKSCLWLCVFVQVPQAQTCHRRSLLNVTVTVGHFNVIMWCSSMSSSTFMIYCDCNSRRLHAHSIS